MVNDAFMKMANDPINKNGLIALNSPKNGIVGYAKARDIFDLICFASWCNGDPALLFFDRINQDNPFYPEVKIDVVNPCVTGDTLIAVADGREAVSILRLEKEGKDVPVYCADDDGYVHIRYARKIRKTGSKVKVFKVNLDDGSFIKATENHNFILRSGKKVQVKDLKEGDSLLRFDKYTYKYHNESKDSQEYWGIQRVRNNCFQEHRLMKEFEIGRKLGKTEIIHHKNSIGLDNYWNNLEIVDALGHSAIHDIHGNRNPIIKLKNRGKFEEWKSKNYFFDNEGEKNPMYGRKHSEESKKKNSNSHLGKKAWNKGLTKETNEIIRTYSEKLKVPHSLEWNEKISKGVKKYYENQVNHKVVSVEFCGYEDVYNMTVDDFHNYAVITSNAEKKKSGIIICNCSEVALPPYSACCLGSINLSKFVTKGEFDFNWFYDTCQLAMRFLTTMNNISIYPLPEIQDSMRRYDPIGVGIMG
ncbi:MAG TPA: NUMOD3 domain-containing DNA-binding protein, partial [bacterium]|nr:NUMOD3 domain-containing DNA-binding protein [bacterium]